MRITGDMPLDALYHSDDELQHWKYIKREKSGDGWKYWYKDKNTNSTNNKTATDSTTAKSGIFKYLKREKVNGKWQYTYDKDAAKKDNKAKLDKTVDTVLAKSNSAAKKLNTVVDKAKEVINKFYDDPANMYDVTSSSYNEKMAKIKESKEWQDIVARGDSEYVKKNSDGTTTYLIDEYVVKKKHPLIDIASDISSGRAVDINEITKETVVAGLKEYAMGTLRTGIMATTVLSTVLTEKFKLQQGSYDDKVAELTNTVNDGCKYVESTVATAKADAEKIKTAVDSVPEVSQADIAKLAAAISVGTTAAEAKKTVNEGNVIKAAQVILESDYVQSAVGDNEYYNIAVDVLGNLSDEEIAALSLLLKQMRA